MPYVFVFSFKLFVWLLSFTNKWYRCKTSFGSVSHRRILKNYVFCHFHYFYPFFNSLTFLSSRFRCFPKSVSIACINFKVSDIFHIVNTLQPSASLYCSSLGNLHIFPVMYSVHHYYCLLTNATFYLTISLLTKSLSRITSYCYKFQDLWKFLILWLWHVNLATGFLFTFETFSFWQNFINNFLE